MDDISKLILSDNTTLSCINTALENEARILGLEAVLKLTPNYLQHQSPNPRPEQSIQQAVPNEYPQQQTWLEQQQSKYQQQSTHQSQEVIKTEPDIIPDDNRSSLLIAQCETLLKGEYGYALKQIMDILSSGYGSTHIQHHSMVIEFELTCSQAQCVCFDCM